MSAVVALAALAAAGAVGIRRLVRARRLGAGNDDAAAQPAADAITPVTPAVADRTVTCVDNGGTPFAVRLSYKRRVATVYLIEWHDGKADDASVVFRSFRFRRAFVGLDPREPRDGEEDKKPRRKGRTAPDTNAAGAEAAGAGAGTDPPPPPQRVWWHGGNSVLLDLGQQRYLFIGYIIYEFTAYDDIQSYVSTMGNSAVPYPFAVGSKNSYLMIENTFIPNHVVRLHGAEAEADPYRVLYDAENIGRWLPGADPKQPPELQGHAGMRKWREAFRLKDFKLVHDRR